MLNDNMRIYNGHRFEIGIFNPRDDLAGWYRGSAEVPHVPVIPRVENADLKSMPHYRFFFLHTTTFYDQFNYIFTVVSLGHTYVLILKIRFRANGLRSRENGLIIRANGIRSRENGLINRANEIRSRENGLITRANEIRSRENELIIHANGIRSRENG